MFFLSEIPSLSGCLSTPSSVSPTYGCLPTFPSLSPTYNSTINSANKLLLLLTGKSDLCEEKDANRDVRGLRRTPKVWSEEETMLLLNIYQKKQREVSTDESKNKIWEDVSTELSEEGVTVSYKQCKSKYKSFCKIPRNGTDEAKRCKHTAARWCIWRSWRLYMSCGLRASVRSNGLDDIACCCLPVMQTTVVE